MKPVYFIIIAALLCAGLFFLFSGKKVNAVSVVQRNQAERLTAESSITIPDGFFLRNSDSGFTVLTEHHPYFVSLSLDTVQFKQNGSSYFFEIHGDTSFFTSAGATKFHKAIHGDTATYALDSNEGYIAYTANSIYYAYRGSSISKDLEQETILCRKNLSTGKTDTILNLNNYLRRNYPEIAPVEFASISGGRFYCLDSNKVGYMPWGLNKVFIIDGTDTSSFTPLNNRPVIRWKTVHSKVPGMGDEVITFATEDGGSEHLNDAVLYYKGKYIMVNSGVFNTAGKDVCYIDVYNARTLAYEKSMNIVINDSRDNYLISFMISNGCLATLSAKGTLSTYKLPL